MVKPKFNKPLNKLFSIVFYLKLRRCSIVPLNGYLLHLAVIGLLLFFDFILFAIACLRHSVIILSALFAKKRL
jgi:hypothetical protein